MSVELAREVVQTGVLIYALQTMLMVRRGLPRRPRLARIRYLRLGLAMLATVTLSWVARRFSP